MCHTHGCHVKKWTDVNFFHPFWGDLINNTSLKAKRDKKKNEGLK